MTVTITRILTNAERDRMNAEARGKGMFYDDHRVFLPGMAWHCPWYFAPEAWPEKISWGGRGEGPMCKLGDPFLSIHYWRDWAHVRPPIAVVLPNSEVWEIDRKSSNGNGWKVTGSLPLISCSPSILAKGYHGFLGSNGAPPGTFTRDVDRPGQPNGVYPY